MSVRQDVFEENLDLHTERLGPLPLINHFLDRLGLEDRLSEYVPTRDRRVSLPYAKGLCVLLRSILVQREPIYRQSETVSTFAEELFGLDEEQAARLSDDAIGRSLDRLFDADRAALLTDIVVKAVETFDVALDELHNDSTSIKFCGQYRQAKGRKLRGKRAPYITYGYSKDHRPDLKQMLFIMTTSKDGGVPLQFRSEAGNCTDARTHEETWDTLRRATGRADFLYVGDSKLCTYDAMDHIDRHKGRFVAVMPRTRKEDKEFREWVQENDPDWVLASDQPNPRHHGGPRDRWWTYRHYLPSQDGWTVVWVFSALLKRRQSDRRRERIDRAIDELNELNDKLTGPRPRRRSRREIRERVDEILQERRAQRYLVVDFVEHERHDFKQTAPGRPGPNTRYVRKTKKYWALSWHKDEDKIAYDQKSDGMYPLITNDATMPDAEVLAAHKRQPTIEKRFEQVKTVFEIAPVLLKNEGRIEALFFVYFLTLLVQALIERELRRAMDREGVAELPLYPEERRTRRPTAEQIFRLFGLVQRNVLQFEGADVRTFEPKLTPLQAQVLDLLGVPRSVYDSSACQRPAGPQAKRGN